MIVDFECMVVSSDDVKRRDWFNKKELYSVGIRRALIGVACVGSLETRLVLPC